MEYSTPQEQCRYRSICTASLFCDFRLLERRSVLDNIHMSYDEDEQELDNLLRQRGLYGKKETWIEGLDSDDHIRVVFLYTLLRHPRAPAVYPPNSPLSIREWGRMSPLLKKLGAGLLVMVVQDENSYPWSDRIIEFEARYVIPGSCGRGSAYLQQPVSKTQFQLQPRIVKRIQTRLHHRFRLKYLLLMLLILTPLILMSMAVFSTALDVIEIEMLYPKQNDLTSTVIEKRAIGNSGEIYEKRYVPMQDADVQILKKELKGDVFAGYVPVDSNITIKSSYLTFADSHTVTGMDTVKRVGLKKIYGHYPGNIYEAATTYQIALDLFSSQYGVQPPELYPCQAVSWCGLPLTIIGVIAENQPNNNLPLGMGGYAGSTIGPPSLNSGPLYVYPGLHKEHSNQRQQTFVPSSKRFIDKLTLRSYEVGNLYPIFCANTYYFCNGEQLHLDNDGENQSIAKKDEVLLDFSAVLRLEYRSRHLEEYHDDALPSWDIREVDCTSSVRNWIGKTTEVQAYVIDTVPDDNTLMKKTVKIKGFLFPITWDYTRDYLKNEGGILMNKETVADCIQPNIMIRSVCSHSEKETDMRKALQHLRQYPIYFAFSSRSRPLRFFVIDLKKMSFLLFISSGATMLFSIALLVHLLQPIMEDGREEMSTYYMFGENMYTLKGCYVQHILALIRRHTVVGCLMVVLVASVFVPMIYMKLPVAAVTLLSLLLPPLASAGYLLLLTLIAHQFVRRACVAEGLFCDEKNGSI